MRKLIGLLFKEDIKTVLSCMLMPLILGITGMILYSATGFEPLFAIVGIGAVAMSFGPLVALVFLANNDNRRFYKDGASFYTCLPYSSEKINLARLMNLVIMGLIIVIISIINLFAFVAVNPGEALSFGEIIREVFRLLGTIKGEMWIAIIKTLIIALGAGLVLAQMIMATNTLGAASPFNKLGKMANGMILAVLFIGQAYLYLKVFGLLADTQIIKMVEVAQNSAQVGISTFDFTLGSFLAVLGVLLAFNGLYFAMINHFHKNKLSVQ